MVIDVYYFREILFRFLWKLSSFIRCIAINNVKTSKSGTAQTVPAGPPLRAAPDFKPIRPAKDCLYALLT